MLTALEIRAALDPASATLISRQAEIAAFVEQEWPVVDWCGRIDFGRPLAPTILVFRHRGGLGEFVLCPRPLDGLGDEGNLLLVARCEVGVDTWKGATHWSGDALPVAQVSWEEARSWTAERGLELPSSDDWRWLVEEQARVSQNMASAAAGVASALGNAPVPIQFGDDDAFGIYHLSDNVAEWCCDGEGLKCGDAGEEPSDGRRGRPYVAGWGYDWPDYARMEGSIRAVVGLGVHTIGLRAVKRIKLPK